MLNLNPMILAGAKFLITNSTARKTSKILIESAFNSLVEILCPNMSMEEVAQKYLPQLENIVCQYQNEGAKYQAGKFKIIYLDDNSFALNFEMYFVNSDGKWLKAENTSSALEEKKWLSPDDLLDLRKNKEKVFFIRFLRRRLQLNFSIKIL